MYINRNLLSNYQKKEKENVSGQSQDTRIRCRFDRQLKKKMLYPGENGGRIFITYTRIYTYILLRSVRIMSETSSSSSIISNEWDETHKYSNTLLRMAPKHTHKYNKYVLLNLLVRGILVHTYTIIWWQQSRSTYCQFFFISTILSIRSRYILLYITYFSPLPSRHSPPTTR